MASRSRSGLETCTNTLIWVDMRKHRPPLASIQASSRRLMLYYTLQAFWFGDGSRLGFGGLQVRVIVRDQLVKVWPFDGTLFGRAPVVRTGW